MHFILKTALIFAITLLVLSSVYSYAFTGDDIKGSVIGEKEDEKNDDSNNESNESSSENNTKEKKDFTHYVFVEAGTTVCCNACAKVHVYLDEFFESGEYPFYYVSMPFENEKAAEYLANYNIYVYPTVYFDGGYEVISGATDWKSNFEDKISSAVDRKVPKILINVTGVLNEDSDEIGINVVLENYEESVYSGRLRVYLTEIVSTKWQGDQPYKYAFIEFPIDEKVEILVDNNLTISKTIDISDLDPENLKIFATLFNSEKHEGFSFPPDKKPFDAYYADAVDSTEIIMGGNLPPMVGIEIPTIGYVHRLGRKRVSLLGKTILLGRTKIVANVTDDSSIEKVEFYINDKLKETLTEEPYEWKWHSLSFGKKTIKVTAYDKEGKTSSAKIDVLALIKWKNPILKLFES